MKGWGEILGGKVFWAATAAFSFGTFTLSPEEWKTLLTVFNAGLLGIVGVLVRYWHMKRNGRLPRDDDKCEDKNK